MLEPSASRRHRFPGLVRAVVVASLSLTAAEAQAEFARPPESPYRLPDPGLEPPSPSDGQGELRQPAVEAVGSTFRFHVGPALLLGPTSPGLLTALDIGPRAVGARLSASWLRAESQQGLSAYSAELWIDFRHRYELHPIVGAGASLLRGGALGSQASAGAGLLRGALEYELPIADADARLSLNAMLLVPAIGTERSRPWAMAALLVGAGF